MLKRYKFSEYMVVVMIIATVLLVVLPMIILGEDYIYTIHDNLDDKVPMLKMLGDRGLFFSVDDELPIMNGISSCYLGLDFGLCRLLYYFMGVIGGGGSA